MKDTLTSAKFYMGIAAAVILMYLWQYMKARKAGS